MKEKNHFILSEGDVNHSHSRNEWQNSYLNDQTKQILKDDKRYFLHQSLSTPCLNVVSECEGIFLTDEQGRDIMDFHGNAVHQVGYRNPAVIKAMKDALDLLPFSPRRYTNKWAVQLAKELTSLTENQLSKVLFAPGATSAIGMALKLARLATGKHKVISMWDSFHGASLDAISIGGERLFRKGLEPLLPGTIHVPSIDSYRPLWEGHSGDPIQLVKYIEYTIEKDGEVGAIVMETIRNTDVQIPPKVFYQELRRVCDRHGVLLILDETPIGLGRTGKMFAYEHYDIIPDIVVLGKGLGGGVFPLAAMLAKEELDIASETALGHYTHEKSPVGAAASSAVISYLKDNNLLERTAYLEQLLNKRLNELKEKYVQIGDIRGIGLLFAVELVKDRTSKERAYEEADQIMYACLKKGLSFKVSKGNVIQLCPPLTITEEELEKAIQILDDSFAEVIQ
ncbi:(R)-1-hydroxy-2-aminoethylphosphonate ammonia-lyase [Brevibacillus porteri]|uniref:(R)-1-hydroxy-2-aminoethylphosphonate ammonia-lyase n=1 Tax=Brevibacillus porteri TaxID=2126350 RepID=UPI003D1A93A9